MQLFDHHSPWWMTPHSPKSLDSYHWHGLDSTHTLAQQWVENMFFNASPSRNEPASAPKMDCKKWIWLQAQQQRLGVGQHGRSFFSPLGGLYATLICLWPAMHTSVLPLVTALSIAEVLGPECSLKWVNDVYWDHKKIAGVLIHRYWGPSPAPCIISLGVNINTRLDHPQHVPITSLYRQTGQTWDIPMIAQQIQRRMAHHFKEIIQRNGVLSPESVHDINSRWNAYGKVVRLQTTTGEILGQCCGINTHGRIILDSGQDYDVLAIGIEG